MSFCPAGYESVELPPGAQWQRRGLCVEGTNADESLTSWTELFEHECQRLDGPPDVTQRIALFARLWKLAEVQQGRRGSDDAAMTLVFMYVPVATAEE